TRASAPLTDVSAPNRFPQNASRGARLSSIRNGIALISALTVASRPADPTERFFATFAMAPIVTGAASADSPISENRWGRAQLEVEPQERGELAERPVGVVHLDRGHPQRARGLQVHPDVVEERGARRRHAELAADEL